MNDMTFHTIKKATIANEPAKPNIAIVRYIADNTKSNSGNVYNASSPKLNWPGDHFVLFRGK